MSRVRTGHVDGLVRRPMRPGTTNPEEHRYRTNAEHVDPAKEATAQATRLANHTTTLADEYARRGQDWEAQLRQRAKELALMSELGLPLAQALSSPSSNPTEQEDEALDETPAGDA